MCMNSLDLSQYPKLKKAVISVEDGSSVDYVAIVGTNLECFKYEIHDETECQISPAACAGIRDLTLLGCTVDHAHLFKDLTATFPLLEQLDFYVYDTDTIKASAASFALRKIKFWSRGSIQVKKLHIECPNLTLLDFSTGVMTDLYVDCPRLRVFHYCATTVPDRLFFRAGDDLEDINLTLSVNYALDTLWFLNLRAFLFLVMANRPTYLTFYFTLPMATFEPEELEVIEASPRYNVHLTLYLTWQDMPNIAPLMDALLWIIRPTSFTIYHHTQVYIFRF
ncbi:hypothetical protein RND81_05G222200 [Saponaria officinalis]|uniref:Uncharacterized protein n=1 Tax=Saponaria officinalis TaxID=3572 RepID=A0AAW1L141_SAPOF